MSKIEWTGETWNPIIGCDKVSAGCKNCYAIQTAWIRQHNPKMAEKYAGVVEKTAGGQLNWTGKLNYYQPHLDKPLRTKKPTVYFVNSMSDLFHDNISFGVIHDIFNVMAACPQHTFQILTKRPARMIEYVKWFQRGGLYAFDFGANIWIGVSVEDQKTADERIPLLLQVPASVRFLSCEPLLEEIDFYKTSEVWRNMPILTGIHWLICGGESGRDARFMHPDWARALRDQCLDANIPFFLKQWGEFSIIKEHVADAVFPDGTKPYYANAVEYKKVGKKKAGRLLDGVEYNEMPAHVC